MLKFECKMSIWFEGNNNNSILNVVLKFQYSDQFLIFQSNSNNLIDFHFCNRISTFDRSPLFAQILTFWSIPTRLKFGSKFTFLTTLDLGRLKFGEMQTLKVTLKIWFKIDIFDHLGPVKDEIWQNNEISVVLKNLAQNWRFWILRTCKGWNLAKFRNFQSRWKFCSKLRVWPHGICKR